MTVVSEPDELWKDLTRIPRRLQSAPRRTRSSGILAAALIVGGILLPAAGLIYWEMQTDQPAETIAVNPGKDLPAAPVDESPRANREPAGKPDAPSDQPPGRERLPRSPTRQTPPLGKTVESTPPVVADREPPETVKPPASAPKQSPDAAQPDESKKISDVAGAELAADRDAAFQRAVNHARAALVARDLDEAARRLDVAEKNIRLPDQLAEVKQLRALAEQLGLFFDAVHRGLGKYEATEEINIDGLVAAIVEVRPEGVTLFIEGSQRDYTIATMPANVTLFFARSGADENRPAAAVFYGAFYAVDPQGDRDKARQLWQQAAAADLSVDDLLPFVDGPPLASRREPIPGADLVTAAAARVQGPLADLIVTAESGPRKSLVATKMLDAARRADNSPEQYAALQQARDWAVSAGDPTTALAALDELGRWFDVDALELKSKALGAALAGRVTTDSATFAATVAMELSAEAHRAGRDELALTLADTAYLAARKARDGALVKRAYRWRSEVQADNKKTKSRPAKSSPQNR